MRLLSRAWVIRNGRGEVVGRVPPRSPGVVGQTPVLVPGHGSFVYSSSAEIDTPTGEMQVRKWTHTPPEINLGYTMDGCMRILARMDLQTI